MFACHLHYSSGMCLHLARTNHVSENDDCGLLESPLLAASPEDGDPPGFSLAEVPGLLGPMVPRVQTIVVSAQNIHKTFLIMSRNLSCKSRN